ncbi:MAG: ChbG/HpnK family deacetylase [Candidatus Moranbacteria bacterium]|nr:ChbG/HpnK family deacetylase [Candidatus Moranbacteria bacterium]
MSPYHFERNKIIVTADDYGIRDSAEYILQLVKQGKLDRVSVLVNYVSHGEAQALLETGVKIDLHLELIKLIRTGEKLKESAATRGMNFVVRYLLGFVTTQKVEEEWRFQIERFRDVFGRLPDGLNSHEHLHYFPRFFPVFMKLAREYGISYVRFGRKSIRSEFNRTPVSKILSMFWNVNRKRYLESDPDTSELFVSYDWLDDFNEITELLSENEKPIEVAVHPERKDEFVVAERFF